MTTELIITQKMIVEGFLVGFGALLEVMWPYLLILLALAFLSRWINKKIKRKKK
jgi:ABC-type amino acid transport system permease subunit